MKNEILSRERRSVNSFFCSNMRFAQVLAKLAVVEPRVNSCV